jgi:hypothetical protein
MCQLKARALPHELTCQRENCTISSQNETFLVDCTENTYPKIKVLVIKMDKLKQFSSDILKCFPDLQLLEAENMKKLEKTLQEKTRRFANIQG